MNKKRKSKKKINKKKILILLIVLILIFVVLFSILTYLRRKEAQEKANFKKVDTISYEERMEGTIGNLYELVKLSNREIDISEFNDEVDILLSAGLKVVYYETLNLSEKEIEDYYEENKDEIFAESGIENLEVFKAVAKKVSMYKDEIKPVEESIVKDSCYIDGDYIVSTLHVKYDNGAELDIKLRFANSGKISYPYLRIQGE